MNINEVFQAVEQQVLGWAKDAKQEEVDQVNEFLAASKDRMAALLEPDVTAEVVLQAIKAEAGILESEGISLIMMGQTKLQDALNSILIRVIQLIPML
jgi:ferredoxin-fold anticodon binding domain-containing protein